MKNKKLSTILFVVSLIIVITACIATWIRGGFVMNTILASTCIAVTGAIIFLSQNPSRHVAWLVIAGLAFSIAGDSFLAHAHGKMTPFIAGIGLFGGAHIAYFLYAKANGKLNIRVGTYVTLAFVTYYCFELTQRLPAGLSFAVLIYLLLSCLTLTAATGMQTSLPIKIIFSIGIGLMMFSDLMISFVEFMQLYPARKLIMPTYYLSQTAICIGTCLLLLFPNSKKNPVPETSEQEENLVTG